METSNENGRVEAERAEAEIDAAVNQILDEAERDIERMPGNDYLRVPLTQQEKLNLGEKIAERHGARANLDQRLKAIKKELQGEIDQVDAEISEAVFTLRNGYELRTVEIETRRDYRRGILDKTRLDTGEIYFERALTASERQREIFPKKDANGSGGEDHGDADGDDGE